MTMATALDQSSPPGWVRVTERAGWQPRDSQGEVVYKNKMWIFGGWFSSFVPAPRDVWCSSDGQEWELVTDHAGWRSSDIPMTLVFGDRVWFMGGWYNGRLPGHTATREVWSSTDGRSWERAPDAGWSPRMGAGAVVFKNKMWILGGTEDYLFAQDDQRLRNDVWCSADGRSWDLVTDAAPWSARALHQAVVFRDKMWILGGGNYQPQLQARNDVWSSDDGIHWNQAVEHAPWKERIWFSAVVYRERVWVLGGESSEGKRLGDVWYSADGKNWLDFRSSVTWSARHEHSALVFQDKLWVLGGYNPRALDSEVWSLEIPLGWFKDP